MSGETLDKDAHAVKTFGDIIIYGYASGRTKFDPWICDKSLTVKSFYADDFLGGPALTRANDAMYECFRTGPVADVTKTFSLADTSAAHQWIDSGKLMGKIAIRI